MLVVETIAGMTYGPWHYVPVRKPGALRNGARFKEGTAGSPPYHRQR